MVKIKQKQRIEMFVTFQAIITIMMLCGCQESLPSSKEIIAYRDDLLTRAGAPSKAPWGLDDEIQQSIQKTVRSDLAEGKLCLIAGLFLRSDVLGYNCYYYGNLENEFVKGLLGLEKKPNFKGFPHCVYKALKGIAEDGRRNVKIRAAELLWHKEPEMAKEVLVKEYAKFWIYDHPPHYYGYYLCCGPYLRKLGFCVPDEINNITEIRKAFFRSSNPKYKDWYSHEFAAAVLNVFNQHIRGLFEVQNFEKLKVFCRKDKRTKLILELAEQIKAGKLPVLNPYRIGEDIRELFGPFRWRFAKKSVLDEKQKQWEEEEKKSGRLALPKTVVPAGNVVRDGKLENPDDEKKKTDGEAGGQSVDRLKK